MKKMNKKGMELGGLYQFVLLLVLVGMLIGVGILTLDKFGAATGNTTTAGLHINQTRDALAEIPATWLPLIVTVVSLAIVLVIVIRSFGGGVARR